MISNYLRTVLRTGLKDMVFKPGVREDPGFSIHSLLPLLNTITEARRYKSPIRTGGQNSPRSLRSWVPDIEESIHPQLQLLYVKE